MHALLRAGGPLWRQAACLAVSAPAIAQPQLVSGSALVSLLQYCSFSAASSWRGGPPAGPFAAAPEPCRQHSHCCSGGLQCNLHGGPDGGSRPGLAATGVRGRCNGRGYATKVVPAAVQGVPVLPALKQQPPDIISKALTKGPAEQPFAAKAYYLGELSAARLRRLKAASAPSARIVICPTPLQYHCDVSYSALHVHNPSLPID